MHIDAGLSKEDWRIKAIHSEIRQQYDEETRNSCISDEELKAYVEKYFLFKSILEDESHRHDTNGIKEDSQRNNAPDAKKTYT